jgi:hypothetical protein
MMVLRWIFKKEDVGVWIELAKNIEIWLVLVKAVMNLRVP